MAGRRSLIAIVLLASALHASGMARAILPAQDGLKFIKVARAFQHRPWADVVRGTDQHPLYPALVALTEPAVALTLGHGPDAWRVAAQLVSAAASVLLLLPLYSLTRSLFGARVAPLAALGFALLPLPMSVGHDTLSDSLALFFFLLALRIGLLAMTTARWDAAVGCGLVAGVGYLARPEVLVVPVALTVAEGYRWLRSQTWEIVGLPRVGATALVFLGVVGLYALVKGEVSEKLALRQAAAIGPSAASKSVGQWLPPGLDDPRWDFSPKEEPTEAPRRALPAIATDLGLQWADGLGGILAFFAVWGLVRDGYVRNVLARDEPPPDPENLGRTLVAAYLGLFALVLVRHELRMGYLSDRHTLTLVTLALPWAAAGVFVCARGVAVALRWRPELARRAGRLVLVAAVVAGVVLQTKPSHASRWGHREAGRWLRKNAGEADAVLDTRGWAAFVSGSTSYDYWHVKQALTDSHLKYVVVGDDELTAESPRGETLRAWLDFAATPVVSFPDREGGKSVGVWVYRYDRPASWEGLDR